MAVTYPGYIQAQFIIPEDITFSAGNALSTVLPEGGDPVMSMIDNVLPAGAYYLTGPDVTTPSLCETLEELLNGTTLGSGWTVTLDESTGFITIDCSDTPWALDFGDSNLAAVLGFAGDIASRSTPATGAIESPAIWLPDGQLVMQVHHLAAPVCTDSMQAETPRGRIIAHVGNSHFEHKSLRYTHVPLARVWKQSTTEEHQSLSQFLRTAQWQMGHQWFVPSSICCIKGHDGKFVGNGAVDGWQFEGLESELDLSRRVQEAWDGVWTVEFPSLVSAG